MIKLKQILLVLLVCICLSGAAIAASNDNTLGFDESLRYDIYFAGQESEVSVIRNVVIQDIREIGGKSFFVIRPQGFKLDEVLGFVRIDSVLSILPQGNFAVRRAKD